MKLLITGGCSFSECVSTHIDTWPRHLEKVLPDYKAIHTGLGSQGNGLISRKVLFQLQKNLKDNDIIVGIVWSGVDRHDFYVDKKLQLGGAETWGWMTNPTSVVGTSSGSWVITNPWWKNDYSTAYYKTFHDHVAHFVYSYEHILRMQWFLEKHKIKYFMSTYTGEVFPENLTCHPEIQHLYNMIDLSKFLPVQGIYEWCRDFSALEFPIKGDNHPSSEQHGLFTEKVIVPFLKEKNYI